MESFFNSKMTERDKSAGFTSKYGFSAALAASLFHYKELEIMDLKNYLADRGVSVRR